VLKLLEAQHHKLARIVKSQDASHQEPSRDPTKSPESHTTKKSEATASAPTGLGRSTKAESTTSASTSALASAHIAKPARDSSPSLARDIASRRGIPQPSRVLSPQAKARQPAPESRRKSAPKVPSSVVDSQTMFDSQADLRSSRVVKKTEDDDGFTKFYSNLTTGTMSKLSSVLAYAGLPLTAEDAVKYDHNTTQKAGKRTVRVSDDPDVKKIFSKAALEAIEDEHRQNGTLGRGFGPSESFYVVQKGGGTYSYADIAKAQQHQKGEEDDEPEFVDAKEAVAPPSPRKVRSARAKRGSFGLPRTEEELELENSTLKNTLEQLAGRLTAFETHAQDASMAALEQSMMIVKPTTPHVPTSVPEAGTLVDAGLQERLRQLESQVERQAESEQILQAKSAKQAKELKKYRHWFDKLESGAREKDKVRTEKKETFGVGDGVTGE